MWASIACLRFFLPLMWKSRVSVCLALTGVGFRQDGWLDLYIVKKSIGWLCGNVIADDRQILNAAMHRECDLITKLSLQLSHLPAVHGPFDHIVALLPMINLNRQGVPCFTLDQYLT